MSTSDDGKAPGDAPETPREVRGWTHELHMDGKCVPAFSFSPTDYHTVPVRIIVDDPERPDWPIGTKVRWVGTDAFKEERTVSSEIFRHRDGFWDFVDENGKARVCAYFEPIPPVSRIVLEIEGNDAEKVANRIARDVVRAYEWVELRIQGEP
jgi:hypothetical protein